MASYQASLEDHQEHNGDTVEGIPAEEHHQAQQSSAEEQGPTDDLPLDDQILQHLQYAHHHSGEAPLQVLHQLHQHHAHGHDGLLGHGEHQQAGHDMAADIHDHQLQDNQELQTTGIPVSSNFDHHLLDPNMAMYHHYPQSYQQQLAVYQQGGMEGGYMVHPDLAHAYPSGEGQGHDKHPDMSSVEEEAAAAHLTALRNTGRVEGTGMEQPMGMETMQGMHDPSMEGYGGMEPKDHRTGRAALSKRELWRADHEGEGQHGANPAEPSSKRRKQTRRPDRLCHHEGCYVTPTYNYPNEKKRIFCVTHKVEGMVNVVAKRCGHPDCHVNPRFNYEGNKTGIFCSEHKLEGMVNVIDRRCQEPDCTKFPSHNYPNSHKKLYCATHKKEGMVDMSHGSSHPPPLPT